MRIAFVRGPSLNLWETQNYLPLQDSHELLLIGSKKGQYCWDSKTEVKRLVCLGELLGFIPGSTEILNRFYGDPQVILGLERAITGFDIVHTAETANYYSYQAVKAKQKGLIKKVVVTCWENIPFNREDYPARKKLKQTVKNGADYFLAVTQGAKRALIAEGVPEEKIEVVPMGVDLQKFKTKGERRKKNTILFVGRLEVEKGVWDLLKAFRVLKNKDMKLQLVMVGAGSQTEKIKTWLNDNKLDNSVKIIDNVDYQEIQKQYRKAQILTLPSKTTPGWQEQFGMVLVEAMASGLPIVTTNSGSIVETVGKAGLFVPANNWQELACALERLLIDKKLRRELSRKGVIRAKKKYDHVLVADKISKVYKQILKD